MSIGGTAIGGGILSGMFAIMFANISVFNSEILDSNKQISYFGAKYVAEASIQKELLSLKSEDLDKIDKFNSVLSQGSKKDSEYGFINQYADTGYFDLELRTTITKEVELGNIVGGDIIFEGLSNNDYFDTFSINYNKGTSSDILVEIIKTEKGGSNYTPCNFYDYAENNCDYINKTVINGADSNLNGKIIDGLQIYYKSGDSGFNDGISIQGFNINSYNYRISFSTLRGESIAFSYYVEQGGEKKQVANNFIEIDTVGNAIDSFSRMRLEKRISNDIQPNSKYVLFSDGEIAK